MSKLLEKIGFKGLNNNQLKIIAMISMAIDHIGLMFFPSVRILRYLGRIAFPIYAYMIAEGCRYTKNRKKYLSMMAAMALVFQIVYLVFMGSFYQGILVNFSLSIATIFAIDSFIKNKKAINRILMSLIVFGVLFIHIGFPKIFSSYGFKIDYNIWGLLLPVIVYFMPNKWWRALGVAATLVIMTLVSGKTMQWWSLMTLPMLLLYNEERGSKKMKYLFYIFYPLHMVIIYAVMYLLSYIR